MSKLTEWLYKTKYVVYFLRQHHNILYVEKKKIYKVLPELISLGNKKFTLDPNLPCFIRDNFRFYFLDYDENSQYSFYEIASELNPSQNDLILGNGILREITKGFMNSKKELLQRMIIGAIMGLLLGLLIMNFIKNNEIKQLYDLISQLNQNNPVVF